MKPWYAANARNLLQDRQNGHTPAGPVVVSLTGDSFDVPTLYVHVDMPIRNMDWRMLVDLQVWLWANPTVALDRITELALQIAKARPKTLFVRFEAERQIHDVQVGDGFHLPKVLPELPAVHEFRVCLSNNSGTPFGASMRRALMNKFYGIQTL